MDLNDLKKTWNKLSSGRELDESQLREMLETRTKSLIERIDRNIKIGFLILFVLIVIFALDDFLLSPLMLENVSEELTIPRWLIFLGAFSNALIFITFIYFVIHYYRVKRSCDITCDLKDTLKKIINTLLLYQRLFYLALIALLFAMGSAFVTGMFEGFSAGVEDQGLNLSDIETGKIILVILIGLVILTLIVGGIFFFLRWGFRRLYGNYTQKLKLTLNELEELTD
ncbi:MAG: hypothetical protein ABFS16_13095 [Bacteroidota bacterium]